MSIGVPPLPRPASGRPEDMERWAAELVAALSAAFAGLAAPTGAYAVTGLAVPQRALNVSTATTADVAAVVGTLVRDLETAGVVTR